MSSDWRVSCFRNPRAAPRQAPLPANFPVQPAGHLSARAVISSWPGYAATPLAAFPSAELSSLGLAALHVKDETARLGVGSFKVLGGGLAAVEAVARCSGAEVATASAGNHGIGVSWACRQLCSPATPCHVFIGSNVKEAQAERIRGHGATVHRVVGAYEDALAEAKRVSVAEGWTLVQDVSWEGYQEVPQRIFEGYTVLAEEILEQLAAQGQPPPTHVLVNGGVGGLAAAVCSHLWARFGAERPRLIVVEPWVSACLKHAAELGGKDVAELAPCDESTIQVGLDTKIGDRMAWTTLATGVDDFVAIDDECVRPCVDKLRDVLGIEAGDSAVAGLGVLVAAAEQPDIKTALGLDESSRVVVVCCEGRPPNAD